MGAARLARLLLLLPSWLELCLLTFKRIFHITQGTINDTAPHARQQSEYESFPPH